MSSPAPLVSIIVPVRNGAKTLGRCLQSLLEQTWGNFEIIVVDDHSEDESADLLRALRGRVRWDQLPEHRGAASARNRALEMANGELLACLDADMWVPPTWLERLLAPLLAGHLDCVGGPDQVPSSAPLLSRCLGYSMDSPLLTFGLRSGTPRLVNYLPGSGNLAFTRQVLERCGRFHTGYHDTGEDKEFLYRVRQAGFRIGYLPEATAWHDRAPDFWLHVRKALRCGRRRVHLWWQAPATFEPAHLAPALLVAGLAGALVWLLTYPDSPTSTWILGCLGLAALALLADGALAARRLADPRAFWIAPLTSVVIPLGYGTGELVALLALSLGLDPPPADDYSRQSLKMRSQR